MHQDLLHNIGNAISQRGFHRCGCWSHCYLYCAGSWSWRAAASAARCVFTIVPKASRPTPRCSPTAWLMTSGTRCPWPSAPLMSYYMLTATGKKLACWKSTHPPHQSLLYRFLLEILHMWKKFNKTLWDSEGSCVSSDWAFWASCGAEEYDMIIWKQREERGSVQSGRNEIARHLWLLLVSVWGWGLEHTGCLAELLWRITPVCSHWTLQRCCCCSSVCYIEFVGYWNVGFLCIVN